MERLTRGAAIEILPALNGYMVRYAGCNYQRDAARPIDETMVFENIESLIIFLRLHLDREGLS